MANKQLSQIIRFGVGKDNETFVEFRKRQAQLREAMIFTKDSRTGEHWNISDTFSPEVNRRIMERIKALYRQ